ncbi:MAG: transposase, partial [Lachnospiraceae bacterium]
MAKKTNDLSHTKWMCKYHIVFTPKYRRKIIQLVVLDEIKIKKLQQNMLS